MQKRFEPALFALKTYCGYPLNTLLVLSKHATDILQTSCGYPPNTSRVPSKHVAGTLQTRCGHSPNMLLGPFKTPTGYQNNREKLQEVHLEGAKIKLFRSYLEGCLRKLLGEGGGS